MSLVNDRPATLAQLALKPLWDFPGGPLVKNRLPKKKKRKELPSNGGDAETKIPHAMGQLNLHNTTREKPATKSPHTATKTQRSQKTKTKTKTKTKNQKNKKPLSYAAAPMHVCRHPSVCPPSTLSSIHSTDHLPPSCSFPKYLHTAKQFSSTSNVL